MESTPDVIEPGNPSFELPWGWQPLGSDEASGTLDGDSERVRSGRHSLHLGHGLFDAGVCQPVQLDPSVTYIWTGWVKVTENGRTDAVLAAGPEWRVIRAVLPTGTRDWTRVRAEFTVPHGGDGLISRSRYPLTEPSVRAEVSGGDR